MDYVSNEVTKIITSDKIVTKHNKEMEKVKSMPMQSKGVGWAIRKVKGMLRKGEALYTKLLKNGTSIWKKSSGMLVSA